MKTGQFVFILSILGMALACGIPAASQPSNAPIDSSTLPTIVVLTADAAMTQTAVAAPVSSPTPDVPVTNLEVLPDGTTKFKHVNGGYEIIFPGGWLTVRPNSDEFNAALAKAGKNTLLAEKMNMDSSGYEAGSDQLFSYALRPDIKKDLLFGFSKLKWDSNDATPLDNVSMGELVRELESSGVIPGFRMDTAQLYQNTNQVNVMEIGGQFTVGDEQSGIVPFYATILFFKPANNTLVRLTFTYLRDYKPEIAEDVTSTINSIKLTGQ